MKPTYKLILGIPGKSNAFSISERLGMDKSIIDKAKSLTSEDDNKLEEIISSLEETRQKVEKEYKLAQQMKIESEKTLRENERLQKEIESKKDEIINNSRDKAKKILEEVVCRSEMIFEELENLKNSKNVASADKRSLLNSEIKAIENLADPVKENINKEVKKNLKFKIGDTVFVSDFNKEGEVLKDEDSSGKIMVQVGAIKTRVLKSHLSKSSKKIKSVSGHVTKNIKSKSNVSVSTEIDLRGQNILEATMELDGFIDTCVIAGLKQITIIHGKGTGQLRKGIQDYLKTNKQIKRFRIGNFGEGESGVTIAELK